MVAKLVLTGKSVNDIVCVVRRVFNRLLTSGSDSDDVTDDDKLFQERVAVTEMTAMVQFADQNQWEGPIPFRHTEVTEPCSVIYHSTSLGYSSSLKTE